MKNDDKTINDVDKLTIVQFTSNVRAIFDEYAVHHHLFRHDQYAGFDLEQHDRKYLVNINYIIHEEGFGDDPPSITKIGKITVNMDDILSLPDDYITRRNAIFNFVRYVIERDAQKVRLKEIDKSIDYQQKRMDDLEKEISSLENPATIDKKLQSLRQSKQQALANVKQTMAEKKNAQELIKKYETWSADLIEKFPETNNIEDEKE